MSRYWYAGKDKMVFPFNPEYDGDVVTYYNKVKKMLEDDGLVVHKQFSLDTNEVDYKGLKICRLIVRYKRI